MNSLVGEGHELVQALGVAKDGITISAKLQAATLHEQRAARLVDKYQAIRQAVARLRLGTRDPIGVESKYWNEGIADLTAALGGIPEGTLGDVEKLVRSVNARDGSNYLLAAEVQTNALLNYAIAALQGAQAEEAELLEFRPPEEGKG